MPYEGRFLDLGGQIHGAVSFLALAVLRWWQAVAQARPWKPRIPPNKARFGSSERGFTGHSLLCFVLLLLGTVLSWWEPNALKMVGTSSFLNKVWIPVFLGYNISLYLPSPARGGCLEFNGGLVCTVKWLKAGFSGSWWFQPRRALSSSSRRHGGGRGVLEAALCGSTVNNHGVVMPNLEVHSRCRSWRPTLATSRWSWLLAFIASTSPTSMRRPFSRRAMATLFPAVPSGSVPGAEVEGHGDCLRFSGGGRGPDCIPNFCCRVCSVKCRGCIAFVWFFKVPTVTCISTDVY